MEKPDTSNVNEFITGMILRASDGSLSVGDRMFLLQFIFIMIGDLTIVGTKLNTMVDKLDTTEVVLLRSILQTAATLMELDPDLYKIPTARA